MSEFFVSRKGDGLIAHTIEDAAAISRLPFGKPIKVTAVTPRNGRFAALYWVMCTRIGNAIGFEAEIVSDTLKIATGHCETIKSKTYGTLYLPSSISFAKMDESSFRAFFEKCLIVIFNEWSIDRKDVLEAVADLLTPTEVIG